MPCSKKLINFKIQNLKISQDQVKPLHHDVLLDPVFEHLTVKKNLK